MRSFATAILGGVLIANAANGETVVTVTGGTTTTTEFVEVPVVTYTTTVVETPVVTYSYGSTSFMQSDTDFFPDKLKQLFLSLTRDIDLKRAELDVAIKEQKDFIATYKSSGSATGVNISAQQENIDFAELSRNQAEESFSLELKKAKRELETLQRQATSAKTEWDAAISSFTVAQEASIRTKMEWENQQTKVTEVANEVAVKNTARASAFAAAKKLEYEPLWAEVLRFTSEMEAEIIRARTVLFQQWAQAAQAMRVSSEAHSQFQVDLVVQAEAVIKQGIRQHQMLVKARTAADKGVAAANLELEEAHQKLIQLRKDGAAAEVQEAAEQARVIKSQQEKAALEAKALLDQVVKDQETANAAAAEAYIQAEVDARKSSLTVQTNLIAEARLRKSAAVQNAKVALASWEEERKIQQSAGSVDTSSAAVMQAKAKKIAGYALAAREAEAMVAEAELKAQQASAQYELKMKELRAEATRNQRETRAMLMVRITEGQGAAMIQAQAQRQAIALRLKIYREALARAKQAELGLDLQQIAMNKALRLVAGQGMEKDLAEQRESESNAGAMWSTAYQQALKTTTSATTKGTAATALATARIALQAVQMEVTTITSEKSAADAKLLMLTAAKLKLKAALTVHTEAGTRLQIAAQEKRDQALSEATASAKSSATLIQQKAQQRALERNKELELLNTEQSVANAMSVQTLAEASRLETMKAKAEAELIQAEAKARARVEGEAHILTTMAINAATKALEEAARSQEGTRTMLMEAKAKLTAQMAAVTNVQLELNSSKTSLVTLEQQYGNKEQAWKKNAETAAMDIASQIQVAAEERSRARWQATYFQEQAIIRAEKHALTIKAQAEQERNVNFFTGIATTSQTEFKNAEQASQWLGMEQEKIEWRIKQQLRRRNHETLVRNSESWTITNTGLHIASLKARQMQSRLEWVEAEKSMIEAENKLTQLKNKNKQLMSEEEIELLTLELSRDMFAFTMAKHAEKKARVVMKASMNTAVAYDNAWRLAKEKTRDSEREAGLEVTRLQGQKIKVIAYLECLEKYKKKDDNVNGWKACATEHSLLN